MTDRKALIERATQAFNALAHSAQADGSIERKTAIWAIKEGRALATALEEADAEVERLAKVAYALQIIFAHDCDETIHPGCWDALKDAQKDVILAGDIDKLPRAALNEKEEG